MHEKEVFHVKKEKSGKKEYSKIITSAVIAAGVMFIEECFVLMLLCILRGYTATAAWLTAAVGLAEAVIAAGLSGYLSLAKSDHSEGGITFEAARASGFSSAGKASGSAAASGRSADDTAASPPI